MSHHTAQTLLRDAFNKETQNKENHILPNLNALWSGCGALKIENLGRHNDQQGTETPFDTICSELWNQTASCGELNSTQAAAGSHLL